MTAPETTRDSMTTPPLTEYMSVAGAVDELGRRGFTEGLRVINGGARHRNRWPGRTEDLVIREVTLGVSDPDDMAIVYGIGPARTQGHRHRRLRRVLGSRPDAPWRR